MPWQTPRLMLLSGAGAAAKDKQYLEYTESQFGTQVGTVMFHRPISIEGTKTVVFKIYGVS